MPLALYFALGGAGVGAVLTIWLAPRMIMWYFTPPVETGINCSAPIAWALSRLRWAELWGVIVGAAVGLVVYGFVQRRRKRQQAQTSSILEGGGTGPVPQSEQRE
jgi:hypothetical protein